MAMKARFFRAAAVLTAALACAPAVAQVGAFPVRPVRMVIPYVPGGAVDILARASGSEMSRIWGQPVIVDNRAGGGGVIAATAVARSPADGYTIFMTDQPPLAITPFLQRDLPFDPVKDFAAVIGLVQSYSILVVPNNFPANSVAELIAVARAKPGAINFGSWGVGSTAHLDPEDFSASARINMTHVPYKSAADMFRGLLSDEIQLVFISLGAAIPQIKQGQLKALGYGSLRRTSLLPDVPTMSESGLPGFEEQSWLGWVVPSGTPRAIINKIATDAGKMFSDQAFVDKYITGVGFEVYNLPPEPFAQVLKETRAKREAQVKRLKLTAY
jgi:tripartite-type tricarboxylate transporter receptor subunit TctC